MCLCRPPFELGSDINQLIASFFQLGFKVFPIVTNFCVIGFFVQQAYSIQYAKIPVGVCKLYANQQVTVFGCSVICLNNSDSRRIRTFDLLLRRQLLYPAELWNHLVQKRRPEVSFCRGGRIRTYDLLLPKQARYRATLHPER